MSDKTENIDLRSPSVNRADLDDEESQKVKGPTKPVKSKKDFQKVMDNTTDDKEEGINIALEGSEEGLIADTGKTGMQSIFDLSSHTPYEGTKNVETTHSNESQSFVDDGKTSKVHSEDLGKQHIHPVKSDVNEKESDQDTSDLDTSKATLYTQTQFETKTAMPIDQGATVTPYAPVQDINVQPIKGDVVISKSNIQDIVNQLIEKAYEMSLDGKTETTITLKHPPILQGANLIVTSFDSAKNEFNIAFENLSQQGKYLLDLSANQALLLNALHEKGYAVHIFTTTTIAEHLVIDKSGGFENERQSFQERQSKERQSKEGQ